MSSTSGCLQRTINEIGHTITITVGFASLVIYCYYLGTIVLVLVLKQRLELFCQTTHQYRFITLVFYNDGRTLTWKKVFTTSVETVSIFVAMHHNVMVNHFNQELFLNVTRTLVDGYVTFVVVITFFWVFGLRTCFEVKSISQLAYAQSLHSTSCSTGVGRFPTIINLTVSHHRSWVDITIVLQSLIRRHEEREAALHRLQISREILLQRSLSIIATLYEGVVSTYHSAHHLCVTAIEGRCEHRSIVGRWNHAVHHINHTIVRQNRLVDNRLISSLAWIITKGEHGVTRVVHDGEILWRHTFIERWLHQVVHQRLHDIQRDLVDVLHQVRLIDLYSLQAITLYQHFPSTTQEVVFQSFVAGHEHHTHILFLLSTSFRLVRIPTWIVGQKREIVIHDTIWTSNQATRLGVDSEITLFKDRVYTIIMESFVVFRQGCIIIRCTETIQNMAKDISWAITTDFLSHTAGRNEHLVKHVEITIQAHNILLNHAITENISTSRIALTPALLVSHNKRNITTLNALLLHIVFDEVCHHRFRIVSSHKDTLTLVSFETIPIVFFTFHLTIVGRKFFWAPPTDTIHNSSSRVLTQSQVFIAIICITHHFNDIRIIELCTIKEDTLLGICELFIRMNSPLIVLEEFLISSIWSDKQCFTTRLRHYLLVTKVFDKSHRVVKFVATLEFVIDTPP